jgi:hypothetical protein
MVVSGSVMISGSLSMSGSALTSGGTIATQTDAISYSIVFGG